MYIVAILGSAVRYLIWQYIDAGEWVCCLAWHSVWLSV